MSQNTVEHALDREKHTPIGLETEDIAPDDGIRMADDTKEHVQIDPQLDRRITRRWEQSFLDSCHSVSRMLIFNS